MNTMRLLLIEDDELLGAGLREFLCADGHRVHWARGIAQAEACRDEVFDAWLLERQLHDGSGLDWLRTQRERGDTTPALMFAERTLLSDRLSGLDGGADDCLVKPFAPEELVARLHAVCRRSAGGAGARLKFGTVAVDLAARSAWLEGRRVELTAREWAVLEALALRAGRIVAKRELESLVLGSESRLASNALEVHVSRLRRKLGRALIETVRGLGYRIGKMP